MEFTKEIDGKKMFAKIGGVALQANGSCLVGLGETVVLATATMDSEEAEFDYFPLTIDYEERFYAAGKIKDLVLLKEKQDHQMKQFCLLAPLTGGLGLFLTRD